MTASCSSRSERVLLVGDVGERADQPHHVAFRPDHGAGAQPEPEIMAVGRVQAEILTDASAPLLDHRVEAGAIAVALQRMQQFEPGGGRPFQIAALKAELVLDFRADDRSDRRRHPSRR